MPELMELQVPYVTNRGGVSVGERTILSEAFFLRIFHKANLTL